MFRFCTCVLHIVWSSVCGQTVKVPFAVRSRGQATKTIVNYFLIPVIPLTTVPMGVTRGFIQDFELGGGWGNTMVEG